VIAEPEERLSVRNQIALLDEAAIALKDDCIGFTLARAVDVIEYLSGQPSFGEAP
jgi:hypothetical protein